MTSHTSPHVIDDNIICLSSSLLSSYQPHFGRMFNSGFLFYTHVVIGDFRFEYEYEIVRYENDFSILVFRLHIITTHTHFIP